MAAALSLIALSSSVRLLDPARIPFPRLPSGLALPFLAAFAGTAAGFFPSDSGVAPSFLLLFCGGSAELLDFAFREEPAASAAALAFDGGTSLGIGGTSENSSGMLTTLARSRGGCDGFDFTALPGFITGFGSPFLALAAASAALPPDAKPRLNAVATPAASVGKLASSSSTDARMASPSPSAAPSLSSSSSSSPSVAVGSSSVAGSASSASWEVPSPGASVSALSAFFRRSSSLICVLLSAISLAIAFISSTVCSSFS
mmetsp:Transcript_58303/g.138951  ORF Transcript_58303/g.138951 Transcript_58303/m.138951 type:complete len:259 (-) Transcript_58303:1156-1932(-)